MNSGRDGDAGVESLIGGLDRGDGFLGELKRATSYRRVAGDNPADGILDSDAFTQRRRSRSLTGFRTRDGADRRAQ